MPLLNWIGREAVERHHTTVPFHLLCSDPDLFYSDFVCKLQGGRILVVEYKSAKDWSNDDNKEKRDLGELWAARSQGKCLFVMPKGRDLEAIRRVVQRH